MPGPPEYEEVSSDTLFKRSGSTSSATIYPRVVFRFMLDNERWNWPVDGHDGIAAFRKLLDRAQVVYTESESNG